MRRKGQCKAELTLTPGLHVKLLITTITVIGLDLNFLHVSASLEFCLPLINHDILLNLVHYLDSTVSNIATYTWYESPRG